MNLRKILGRSVMFQTGILLAFEMSFTGCASEVKLNERGDAGPSVADEAASVKPVLDPDRRTPSGTRAVRTAIHVLGGGVRGFGILARFAEPGPGKIQIRRATSFPKGEPYTPIALARIFNPDGKTVSVTEMTEQKDPESVYSVDVPGGAAGIWRISISGGRQFDKYEIKFAESKSWGVRGEMSLPLNDSIPNPAYLYLPSSVKQMAIERIGGGEDAMEVFDELGKSLGFPVKSEKSGQRCVLQLDDPPPNSVLKLVFKNTEKMTVLIDGVPGLLCPSPEIARDLKGGTVESGGMNSAGPLQARARNWMLSCPEKDLEVKPAPLPAWSPDKIASPMSEAQLCANINQLPENLKNQNLDKADPFYGSPSRRKPDQMAWDVFHYCLLGPWDTASLATPAAIESPINPYFKNEALVRRVTLSAFAKISSLQGDDLPREPFLGKENSISYPIVHAFFAYGALAENFELMKDVLEPVQREIWRDAVIAVGDKLADNQGYQSNQWTHNLSGHLAAFRSTGEQRFLGYFERQLNAYLDGAWGPNAKFGQHPAGFYLEEFGADGNYDNMNLASIVKFYYLYKELKEAKPALVGKLKRSIEADLNFKSFFWTETGTCPTATNSRRNESSLMASNPVGDYLAHREFDLALSRTKLTPMPAKGTFPANVFAYYAVTDEWARRILAEFTEGKCAKFPGGALFYNIYAEIPLVSKEAIIPFKAEEGAWELPGLLANKSKGFYVLDFHDVAGTDKKRRLLSILGGGPTIISSDDLGPFIMSMAPLTAGNAVDSEDNLTFSCVFAKSADGKIVYSGKERSAGKWIEKGKSWEVHSEFMGGELTWRYEFSGDSVLLKASLEGGNVSSASSINLPVLVRKEIDVVEGQGGITLKRQGMGQVEIKFPGNAIFTKAVPCSPKGYSVRRLQVPLATDGAWTEILISKGHE
ncbi:MAG: hypothetical protein WAX69_08005 [Victivallales bacterium]